jgi:hypothetical protein
MARASLPASIRSDEKSENPKREASILAALRDFSFVDSIPCLDGAADASADLPVRISGVAACDIEESESGWTLFPSSMPLFAYCAHLSLGDAWNRVFFGTTSTLRGLRVILAFRAVLWLSACLFYREDSIAGLLLLPTCVWVTVAGALNWTIHILNSEKRG